MSTEEHPRVSRQPGFKSARGAGALRERLAHPRQRSGLDLPGPLARETECVAGLVERLGRLTESVVGSNYHLLAFGEVVGDGAHLAYLRELEHLLEGLLGNRIDDRVSDRPARVAFSRERLVEGPWHPLG